MATTFTFVFAHSAYFPLGYQIIVYADNIFNATKIIIAQMNIVNKAKGRTLITVDPDEYTSTGITALIAALNLQWQDEDIIQIKGDATFYPVN